MKVYFSKVNDKLDLGVTFENSSLYFSVIKPLIIQPSEIENVLTNVIIKTEEGMSLYVTAHSELFKRKGELFPSVLFLDSTVEENPLILSVHNKGQDALNLIPGQKFAQGRLVLLENIEPESFSISRETTKFNKNKTEKNNKEIRFNLK